jgi:hypothetical protein
VAKGARLESGRLHVGPGGSTPSLSATFMMTQVVVVVGSPRAIISFGDANTRSPRWRSTSRGWGPLV